MKKIIVLLSLVFIVTACANPYEKYIKQESDRQRTERNAEKAFKDLDNNAK